MIKPLHKRRQFTATILEKDRQKAESYLNNRDCLIATVVKRLGGKDVNAGPYDVDVDGSRFYFDEPLIAEASRHRYEKPYYSKDVVAKKVVFSRTNDRSKYP